MVVIDAYKHQDIYWAAHTATISKNMTPETANIPYYKGLRELYIKWWWDDYGVVLEHDIGLNGYKVKMYFKTEEEWFMFRLKWADECE